MRQVSIVHAWRAALNAVHFFIVINITAQLLIHAAFYLNFSWTQNRPGSSCWHLSQAHLDSFQNWFFSRHEAEKDENKRERAFLSFFDRAPREIFRDIFFEPKIVVICIFYVM